MSYQVFLSTINIFIIIKKQAIKLVMVSIKLSWMILIYSGLVYSELVISAILVILGHDLL